MCKNLTFNFNRRKPLSFYSNQSQNKHGIKFNFEIALFLHLEWPRNRTQNGTMCMKGQGRDADWRMNLNRSLKQIGLNCSSSRPRVILFIFSHMIEWLFAFLHIMYGAAFYWVRLLIHPTLCCLFRLAVAFCVPPIFHITFHLWTLTGDAGGWIWDFLHAKHVCPTALLWLLPFPILVGGEEADRKYCTCHACAL